MPVNENVTLDDIRMGVDEAFDHYCENSGLGLYLVKVGAFDNDADRHTPRGTVEVAVAGEDIEDARRAAIVYCETNVEIPYANGDFRMMGEPSEVSASDLGFDEPARFRNHYQHCDTEWADEWSCACNDRCPSCDSEIEPYTSEDLTPLPDDDLTP